MHILGSVKPDLGITGKIFSPAGYVRHWGPFLGAPSNRPFATNDHMVQNPPCWRASSLLFPHWDIKTKRPQPVKRDWPLFKRPSAEIIMSLPSSMADFVPCDRLLQKAYYRAR